MKSTLAFRWLLGGIIFFGLVGWVVTGLLLYARLAYMGLLLVVGAGILAVISMRGIHLNRQARILRASMGDVFEEHFEVRNATWPACLWLEIINRSNLPMAGGSRLLTSIGAHQRRFYTARTLLYQRGAFLLGPTSMASGDPFGLFTIRKLVPAKDTLVVLPMTAPINDFPPPPGLLPGGKTIRQRTSDMTPHAAGVREYVPGDPMKRIHWPSTAHRGRFMVKEFEQDPQADIWLFLDAQKEVQTSLSVQAVAFSEDGWWLRRPNVALPRDSCEYGISTAASVARYFLMERRAVGLACAAGKFNVVSAERGERQVNKIMETLAFLQPEGTMPMLGLVTMRAKLLPIGTGVILITPSTRPELLLAVEDLQRRNLRPVVVLIKAETFGGTGESKSIIAGLLRRNVPVCPVGFGDNLSVQLTLPAVYFKRQYLPKTYFSVRA
ncbi:MAG: DUF58 domain-containing protein [Chloroflexi bacterium]|nr:DUF58 domain-containing protein [Chloroflexota bacterium]